MSKPIASLSLDLDNKWSYLKTHGDEGWEVFPSYLDLVVPRILEILDKLNLKITFFVVGQDAALEKNHGALKMIADAGHEIANHSFHHDPWLHLFSNEELVEEFQRTEDAIFEATGKRPVGFRGPGFSLSQDVLKLLVDRNYEYDCSTFPTFLGPVARAYYFLTASFNKEQKEDRKALFGKLSDGFQPLKPFKWDFDKSLVEIPVSTMPIFKIPFHLSYIHYLAQFSTPLARLHFWKSITLCRLTGTPPSVLLHPLDFLGSDDDADLAFFPGMKPKADHKLKLVTQVLNSLATKFDVVTMREHARRVCAKDKIRHRSVSIVRPSAAS